MSEQNIWKCSRCGCDVPIEDVFVISQGGPKISLRPFCELCVDIVLAEHQEAFNKEQQ